MIPQFTKHLHRENIVGRRIKSILQTPWIEEKGISTCSVFVFFDNNSCIQIDNIADSFREEPIPCIVPEMDSLVLPDSFINKILGQEVKEVVVSQSWPPGTFGLLLTNGLLLCFSDYSPFVVGPLVISPDMVHNPIFTYWGHQEMVFDQKQPL